MSARICVLFCWFCTLHSYVVAEGIDPETATKIRNFAETVLECREIVGLNLVIVKDGSKVFSEGYGKIDLDTEAPVKTDTKFGIASLSKAFASTLLAKVLSEQERYTWDTPVRDILGEDMYFPTADMSVHTRLRDLLAHKTGLSPSNNVRIQAGLDRMELVKKIRFLKPVRPYKGSYVYNNLMYGLISRVTEVIGGQSWEELMESKIFRPLGMNSTSFTHTADLEQVDIAKPYLRNSEEQWQNVSLYLHSEWGKLGGSGSILSSADDMDKWLQFQLDMGRTPSGDQLVPENLIRDTHTPHNNIPVSDSVSAWIRPNSPFTYTLLEYGLAWRTGFYRGWPLVSHTGTSFGYGALLTLVPDLKLGLHTSVTGSDSKYMGRRALHLYAMDLLMGEEPWLNLTSACSFPETTRMRKPRVDLRNLPSHVVALPLAAYAGVYGNYAYGNVTVSVDEEAGGLEVRLGDLGHWIIRPDEEPHEFQGEGQGHMWSVSLYNVKFSGIEDGVANFVELGSFDWRAPPVFERGLKMSSAPAPPDLECQNISNTATAYMLELWVICTVLVASSAFVW